MGDKALIKSTALKGKHKIQDHWKDTVYCVEGQSYIQLLVFKITLVAGDGKVKIVHQNLSLPFGCNIKGVSENEGNQ